MWQVVIDQQQSQATEIFTKTTVRTVVMEELCMYLETVYRVSNTGNTFMNNTARYDGGALYLSSNNSVINAENNFSNNTATRYGGAMYV